ncbi:MAG: phosphoribosylanthranilate isomerase [Brevinematia bacterium]
MKLKFCGFTRIDDVKLAINLGVDYQGFIFFEGSKRFVSIDVFDNISKNVKGNFVAVFVNENVNKVIDLYNLYQFSFVQLHGEEDNEYIEDLLNREIPVIKAFRIKNQDDAVKIKECISEFVLLDAFVEGTYGGTGKRIDETLLNIILSSCNNKKVFLSGGINKYNISDIIKKFGSKIFAIDISSGIEESPGIKSHILMKEVFNLFKQSTS